MKDERIHVMHTFANNDGVPYMTWFMQRASEQRAVRFTIVLLHTERPAMLDEIKTYGFDGLWIKFDNNRRGASMLKALPKLWWHMMRLRPDIVHGHLFDDTLPAMIAAWLARIKGRMYTRQDTGFHLNYAPKWVFLDRLIARLATLAVAVSEDARSLMLNEERTAEEKVAMVHHGIPTSRYTTQDTSAQQRLRDRFMLDGAFPVIGTLARFIEWKGYRHIIDAAVLIVKAHPSAKFLFCGSGPQLEAIRSMVKDQGLEDHVTFTGWVDRDDVPSLYRIMDIYLHAADHEPFGFVYAEAMMSGTPVVSTSTGAAKDAIDGPHAGFLVRERSGRALAEGVEQLLSSDHIRVGLQGQDIAMSMYSFDRMWEGYLAIYRRGARGN